MRFGLIGTGPWATTVHGPTLANTGGAELVGVWGRSPDKASTLADDLGVRSLPDLDAMFAEVDAVAFAVPPDVQAELAVRAARAGKHLLLDKPVALDAAAARAIADAAEAAGVLSVVFFTHRFTEESAAWLADAAAAGDWLGGGLQWLAALDSPGNPYAQSVWRRERGALWDIGPHALSTLIGALGAVTRVVGVPGERDLVHLVLEHAGGATSTATLSLFAPPPAATHDVRIWGPRGVSHMPTRASGGAGAALARAIQALGESTRTGEPHPADLRLGVEVVELLEDVDRQLEAARAR